MKRSTLRARRTEGMDEVYPLSTVQRHFWILQQLDPENSTYHVVSLFRIKGRIQNALIERSINRIVSRHSVFRTGFQSTGDGLIQIVIPEMKIPVENMAVPPGINIDSEIDCINLVGPCVSKPFALENPPLLRCAVFSANAVQHLLLVVAHHIIFDPLSKNLFLTELSENYRRLTDNKKNPEKTAAQYFDYSLWQNQPKRKARVSTMASFWQKELSDSDGHLHLPTDFKRPATQAHKGAAVHADLPQGLSENLKRIAEKNGIPVFIFLLTAYYILLSRYSRQTDITIGIPFDIRRKDKFKNTLGCFLHILPARTYLSDNPEVGILWDRVEMMMARADKNKEIPFEKIVEILAPVTEPSWNPIFQTGFSFEDSIEFQLYGSEVQSVNFHPGGARLDLFVTFRRDPGGKLTGVFEYDTELFRAETIERITKHFTALLADSIAHPEKSIAELQMMDADERNQICIQNNSTEKELPPVSSFISLFEQRVRLHEQSTAVAFQDKKMSYHALNQRANQIARHLIHLGAGKGNIVGVCLERSMEMLAAILGVLKCGAAYLPLDPEFPRQRRDYILSHSGVQIFLTEEKFRSEFSSGTLMETVFIDTDGPVISINSDQDLQNAPLPDQPAYVMYTSGSTGNPKGVQVRHGSVLNFLWSMKEQPGLADRDIFAAVTTISFDISVLELFLPLITGAGIVLVDKRTAMDGAALSRCLQQHNVNTMQATPTTWRLLLAAGWTCDREFKILCGGEALPDDLVKSLTVMSDNVWNMYGPTETTVWSTCYKFPVDDKNIMIGKPIANTQVFILDDHLHPVPLGVPGELYIGGKGVSKGYLNDSELTKERFIPNPLPEFQNSVIYKTGDVCRLLADGNIQYIDRVDFQVKIRGYRIELGEIENRIRKDPTVRDCMVIAEKDDDENKYLVCYVIERVKGTFSANRTRSYLKEVLPGYMIPEIYILLDSFPLTPNNKLDRKALPKSDHHRPDLSQQYIPARTGMEKMLEKIWKKILRFDRVGIADNFFDLGGNSLLAMYMTQSLIREANMVLPIVKLFEFPTIKKLAEFLEHKSSETSFIDDIRSRAAKQSRKRSLLDSNAGKIAVIGMAGRFPGADTIDQLWENLCNKIESISFFEKDELGPGIDPDMVNDPDYVMARGIIRDADKFDAAFFGINPNEAKIIDPQQRVFLELAWAAMENAGYDPDSCQGVVGVYAGVGDNYYYPTNLLPNSDILKMVGSLAVEYGNIKDYIATRISYCLNLTGPSVNVNTACSTGLSVIDAAFKALLNFECDMALAGAVDISIPQKHGFLHEVNGTFSKDGHCRPFDSRASGTLFCDGAGIVVLKRLSDALEDKDRIYAVIRSTAINNDGSNKISFLAPSVEGQSRVIAMAQVQAGVNPAQISYIEAHGTGTPIGDPIEIEALTKVFRLYTDKKQFCHIGSIKGNIGHPTNASGVAGLIKAALCLYHEKIPATLHFTNPNPNIDFADSPFKVASELIEWKRNDEPRIAGISSFGFGGTNVHAIIEEAPPVTEGRGKGKPRQLILLSAKTQTALDKMTNNLAAHLEDDKKTSLEDTAYTLQTGRKHFGHRRFVVARNREEAVKNLRELNPADSSTRYCDCKDPEIIFMFPGQGAQYVNMGRNLYDTEPIFQAAVDDCAQALIPYLNQDLRSIIFVDDDDENKNYDALKNTFFTQPAIFMIEYALAKLWLNWGITPDAMVGHSVGEFVCAVLSGIFKLEDALRLVALRGRLISELPGGAMLSIRKPAKEIESILPEEIQLAASNSSQLCVVSGPEPAVSDFSRRLEKENIISKRLHTSHAFHSAMMDPAVDPFIREVQKTEINPPCIPFLSTLSLEWISRTHQSDAFYWGKHMRMPVRFSEAIDQLAKKENVLFLEVGPRTTLATLIRQQIGTTQKHPVVHSLSDTAADNSEWHALSSAVGNLWLNGVTIDWQAFYRDDLPHKVPLPTYPFEKKRYWIDPPDSGYIPKAPTRTEQMELAANTDPIGNTGQTKNLLLVLSTQGAESAESKHQDGIIHNLVAKISEIWGQDLHHIDPRTTFVEMGMDSLFLTQLAYKLKHDYKVPLTFSNLIEEYPNIDCLSRHISRECPEMAAAEPPASNDMERDLALSDMSGRLLSDIHPESWHMEGYLRKLLENQTRILAKLDSFLGAAENRDSKEKAVEPAPYLPEDPTIPDGEPHGIPFNRPPVSGAKLGRDLKGDPHWFVADDKRRWSQIQVDQNRISNPVAYHPIDFNPLEHGVVRSVVESTEAQRELWLSCQNGPEASCAYNESISLKLKGPLDLPSFERAVNSVIARHDAFRTTFSSDGMYLLFNQALSIEIRKHDFSNLDNTTVDSKIAEILEKDGRSPFDLKFGPLIRFSAIKTSQYDHVIIFTAHHVICDGWSMDVLLKDVSEAYSNLVKGESVLVPEPMQFSTYANMHRKMLNTAEYHDALKYWLNRFKEPITNLELPYDRPRPIFRSYEGGCRNHIIDEDIATRIKIFSKEAGISIFTIYLSAFTILLNRLTMQEDIILGIPAAGQPAIGEPRLIGHCVNLLPLRLKIRENETFIDFLKNVHANLLKGSAHNQCTYGSILNALKLPREKNRMPLVSVGFTNSSKYKKERLAFAGLEYDYFLNPRQFETFDIYLNVRDNIDATEFKCHYNRNLFDGETILSILNRFETVLKSILDNRDQIVSKLKILPDREENELLIEYNNTRAAYPENILLHQFFEDQVKSIPDAVAVVFKDREMRYRELNEKADMLADQLVMTGLKPDEFIAVYMNRSIASIIGILAVLKAGAAFLPIDPDFPGERIDYMIRHADAAVILTQPQLLERLSEYSALKIVIDEEFRSRGFKEESREITNRLPTRTVSDNLAYLLYTSGSTGKPKGVQIPHKAVVNFISSMGKLFKLSKRDALLAITTFSFDISILEIFLPLSNGAAVILADKDDTKDGRRLIEKMSRHDVSIMQATPATWRLLLDSGWKGKKDLRVLCGGEAMPRDLIKNLHGRVSELWNMYGPTETTIWSSCFRINNPDEPPYIGKPIDNTQFYILDQHLQPVAKGVTGELYIGGAGLSRGYLKMPEMTAERFIVNPFSMDKGARIYKTGDLCRFRSNGVAEYISRNDNQVKIRGFRIEVGDIEAALCRHSNIKLAVVSAHTDKNGDKYLAAYIVTSDTQPLSTGELRSFLIDKIPDYMIPSAFQQLETLPHTPNGKVDRRSLPVPAGNPNLTGRTYVTPRNKLEEKITSIWREVLRVDKIGIQDDFFDLGGHSLTAVRMFHQIQKTFGKKLPLSVLYDAPDIERLAAVLDIQADTGNWPSLVKMKPGDSHHTPFFCIHGAGGNVLLYKDLIKHLRPEQTVYGLQAQGLNGRLPIHDSIEEMASFYINEIKTVQPAGPYLLGGYCMGGAVAYEMARQLHSGNESAALVSLFETSIWSNPGKLNFFDIFYHHVQKIDFHFRNVLISNHKISFLKEKSNIAKDRGFLWADHFRHRKNGNGNMEKGRENITLIQLWGNNDHVLEKYRPRKYPGRITLFTPAEEYRISARIGMDWSRLAEGGVCIRKLPVYPAGMLIEPFAALLAAGLTDAIDEAVKTDIQNPSV